MLLKAKISAADTDASPRSREARNPLSYAVPRSKSSKGPWGRRAPAFDWICQFALSEESMTLDIV